MLCPHEKEMGRFEMGRTEEGSNVATEARDCAASFEATGRDL
jgi:hypothetical protein